MSVAAERKQMLEVFREKGIEGLTDLEIVNLLLSYAMPRRESEDITALAQKLMTRFLTLGCLFESTVADLEVVPELNESAITLLRLVPEVSRRYMVSKNEDITVLNSLDDIYQYVGPLFAFYTNEHLFMICLNEKNMVLDCTELGSGDEDSVALDTYQIAKIANSKNAKKVLLTHNHPNGVCLPSTADIHMTQRVVNAMKCFDITVLDHIIVTNSEFLSMREVGSFERRY